jgi:hypothetical protein
MTWLQYRFDYLVTSIYYLDCTVVCTNDVIFFFEISTANLLLPVTAIARIPNFVVRELQ